MLPVLVGGALAVGVLSRDDDIVHLLVALDPHRDLLGADALARVLEDDRLQADQRALGQHVHALAVRILRDGLHQEARRARIGGRQSGGGERRGGRDRGRDRGRSEQPGGRRGVSRDGRGRRWRDRWPPLVAACCRRLTMPWQSGSPGSRRGRRDHRGRGSLAAFTHCELPPASMTPKSTTAPNVLPIVISRRVDVVALKLASLIRSVTT